MQAVVEFVKEHLQPAWKAKQVDRDAFRLITRKVADKVLQAAPREAKPLLQDPEIGSKYLTETRRSKIGKLVDGYVVKHGKSA